MIIFGLEFYVNNYNNQNMTEEIKELFLEGLLKIFQYSGKLLKKLKKKKRKKKI